MIYSWNKTIKFSHLISLFSEVWTLFQIVWGGPGAATLVLEVTELTEWSASLGRLPI